jgi:hypothetical protein
MCHQAIDQEVDLVVLKWATLLGIAVVVRVDLCLGLAHDVDIEYHHFPEN